MRQLRAFYILYHIHIAGSSQDSLGTLVGEVCSNISTSIIYYNHQENKKANIGAIIIVNGAMNIIFYKIIF